MWSATFETLNNEISIPGAKNASSLPDLIVLFCDTDLLATSTIPQKLQLAFPKAKVIGCSTGTSVVNSHLSDDAISGIAIGFDSSRVEIASCEINNAKDSFKIGTQLGTELRGQDLACIFVLSDGLNVNGSDIVNGILSVIGSKISVFGGLAGDGARFEKTIVIENGQTVENRVIALGLYGKKLAVSHGSDGGWLDYGVEWEITQSDGNVMMELDGKNAYETYSEKLGEKAKELPSSGLLYPLKIWHPDYKQHDVVRTLLSVDKDAGTLTFAGDVPKGWRAALMFGNKPDLILGAQSSTIKAIENFKITNPGVRPEVCFMVSCVGRRLLLGDDTKTEVETVLRLLPKEIGFLGFYAYGEIAPHKMTKLCSLHNQTLTLTLIGEAK